jgi:hypothetical protein
MGRARSYGYSLMLGTPASKRRAKRLVQKNKDRFEIEEKIDGLFFYYLPPGVFGSEEIHENGLVIANWVETGRGTEPN